MQENQKAGVDFTELQVMLAAGILANEGMMKAMNDSSENLDDISNLVATMSASVLEAVINGGVNEDRR